MNMQGLPYLWRRLQYRPYVKLSALALMASNAIPLVGVLLFGWSIYFIMILFWLENVITGVFNVLKMAFAANAPADGTKAASARWSQASKLMNIPFFIVHYGIFTIVHGFFVFVLFRPGGFFGGDSEQSVFEPGQLLVPLAALFVSHGFSFIVNYLYDGEYKKANTAMLLAEPYGRVIALHVTIIIGGILAMYTSSTAPALAILVLVKICIDLRAHIRQHLGRPRPEILFGQEA